MREREIQEQEFADLTPLDERLETRLIYWKSIVAAVVWTIVICACTLVFAFAGNPRVEFTW